MELLLYWSLGWFITTTIIILVDPPDNKETEVAKIVFISLIGWPVLVVMLFPVYLFTYMLYLRNRYL